MRYENILIAIDGSREAKDAFDRSLEVAKRNDARLVIAHVIETTTYLDLNGTQMINDAVIDAAKGLLNEYKEVASKAGVREVHTVLEYGDPKVVIPKKIAKKEQIHLIICGATGMGAIERFFVGSVSENITRHAKCDVLVMRNKL